MSVDQTQQTDVRSLKERLLHYRVANTFVSVCAARSSDTSDPGDVCVAGLTGFEPANVVCHLIEMSVEFGGRCLRPGLLLRQLIGCSMNRLLEVRILSAQPA